MLINIINYLPLSLSLLGSFIGLAGAAMLINIIDSLSLSLSLLDGFISLAGVTRLINIIISSLSVFPPWWLSGSCRRRNAYIVHQLLSVFPPWWLSGSCRRRNAYVVHQLLSVFPPWWLSGSCRRRNAYKVHQLLSVFPPWWLSGSCRRRNVHGVHQLFSISLSPSDVMVAIRGKTIRFYTHNPVPVNMHCRDLFISYRDFYLLAIGLWGFVKIVMYVLVCYLPQLQHHAPGASESRSLALLARLRVDLWTLLGENCTGGWRQLPVALVPPQARWLQQHLCRYLLHLWLEAQKKAPLQECQGPRASVGPSVRHPAALKD